MSWGDLMGLREYVEKGIVKVWDDVYDSSLDDKAAPNLCDVYFKREVSLYTDPEEFFKHTYLTKNMKELIEEITDSLKGKKGSRTFLLTSLYGGGKTHTLITIYHAFRSPEKLKALDETLAAKVAELGRTEVIVMDAYSSKLVPHPSEPYRTEGFTISTIWGMLAHRLGAYAKIRHLDSKESPSPEIEGIRSILSEVKVPTIILLDEIVPYVFNMSRSGNLKDYGDKVILFLGNLAKAVEAFSNVVLVISIQAEYRGEGDIRYEDLYRDVAEKILRQIRRESTRIIVPVSPEDIVMVLRRRIFSDIRENVNWEAQDRLYSVYRDHSDIFGMESDWQSSIGEAGKIVTAKDTYPFHPKYVEVLQEFITRNKDLQKTRDAIRITRKVVRGVLKGKDVDFIMPWHIDLRDKDIRNMVLTESYKEFRDVVNRDIASEDGSLGSVISCSKHMLALRIATAILLKTYTYETFKEPLKVFPDLKDVALMTYEPGTFSSENLQPPDIKATIEEMQSKLPHFAEENNRFWFTPYPSVLEYVEKKAEEKLRGPRLDLYRKLVDYAEKALVGSIKKGERPAGEVFTTRNTVIAGYGDDIRSKELIAKDIQSLRLLVLIKPGIKEEELRDIILNRPEGGGRTFANTIVVVYPPSNADFDTVLRYIAKIEAAKEIQSSLDDYYKDKDIKKLQEGKLKSYIQENEGSLMQQILSIMTKVAYPRRGRDGNDVNFVETSPSSSLISQVEMVLKDPRTGPKLRTDLRFEDLATFLKDNFGWDLRDGNKQFEFREILEVFYTNTAAPFTTREAVKDALLSGLELLDIGIKIGKKLYWKKIGSEGAEKPKTLEETAVILPYKMAAGLMKDELLSNSGMQKIKGGIRRIWYEVSIEKETIPLEELVKREGWEDILKAGVIQEREEIIERGFVLDVKPSHVDLKPGEKAEFTISIVPVDEYPEEVELEVKEGNLSQNKGRPPMEVKWEILLEKPGKYSFSIRAVGSDGLHRESSVSITVLSPEEEIETNEIDLRFSGEKLLAINSSELPPLRIAIDITSKLGIKAMASITARFGENVGLSADKVDIEVARFLAQKLDEMFRFMNQLGVKISVNGSLELKEPIVLDEPRIKLLSQLNGKVKFKLSVRRK